MNYEDYNRVIHRTAAQDIHFNVVKPSTAKTMIDTRLLSAPNLDAVKKGLFYGKPQERLNNCQNDLFPETSPHIASHQHLVHAVLGIDSESAELLQMVNDTIFCGQNAPSRDEIIDEAGDLLWYYTFLLKIVGASLEEVMERNFRKLSARFPEGTFSLEQWEGRDKDKEMEKMLDTIG